MCHMALNPCQGVGGMIYDMTIEENQGSQITSRVS